MSHSLDLFVCRHLLIMESLGGDQAYWVRFMAQHSAIAYFIGLCLLWGLSPSLSYRFSELLETHAVNTYGQFLDENEEILKKLPPPLAAVEYYSLGTSDPSYAEFQTTALAEGKDIRRPGVSMKSLYDTFTAIRADEGDHVSTMKACLDPSAGLRSASLEVRLLYAAALTALATTVMGPGSLDVLQDTLGDGGTGLSGVSESLLEDSVMVEQAAEIGLLATLLKGLPGPVGVVVKQTVDVVVQILTRLL